MEATVISKAQQRESDRMIINQLPLLLDRNPSIREAIARDYIQHTHCNLIDKVVTIGNGSTDRQG